MAIETKECLELLEVLDIVNTCNKIQANESDMELENYVDAEIPDSTDDVVMECEIDSADTSFSDTNDDLETLETGDGDVDILQSFVNIIELHCITNCGEEPSKDLKKRKRRWGVHSINQMRKELGHFENLVQEMMIYDHDKFFNYTRMSPAIFDHLLKYLATGDSLKSMHYIFRVGASTAFSIVNETCKTLWIVLQPIYLKYPTQQDWLRISAEFEEKLKFPNCCGAVDGKLIEIRAPKKSGSKFFSYMRYVSTNLLAVCDARKNFIYVDIGSYGRQSDGGIFFHSTFGKRLDTNSLGIPPPAPLPNTKTLFPFFIIADTAYPLHQHVLTPYPGKYFKKTTTKS
ncbi:Protein ALP1-like [Pseudolycoriella hygida]|uniref:Protein ALP1-like n=1 Tax=Pseudolycoriella hygida TaxID=35572 RepID=A0A9Q0N4U7_9DIPT|nr:Protein ALP1-like [Pseudolycoriella hygida]